MELKIELNVCLLPDTKLSKNLVCASQLAESCQPSEREACIVTLQGAEGTAEEQRRRLQLAPHLTLYQISLPVRLLEKGCEELKVVAGGTSDVDVTATELAYNAHEGSLEVRYSKTDQLTALQSKVIECLNPLRGSLLLERDPAGEIPRLDDMNVCEYGFPEVGLSFRPHATLNWYATRKGDEPSAAAAEGDNVIYGYSAPPSIDIDSLSGRYSALAVCVLGPQGTCPQTLIAFDFGSELISNAFELR